MPSTLLKAVLLASAVISQLPFAAAQSASKTIVSIASPSATVNPNTPVYKGCFSYAENLDDHGAYDFQSSGNCQRICVLLDKAVFALSDGSNCYCGDLLPPNNTYVAETNCDTPCGGYPGENCGGPHKYSVWLTAITKNRIEYEDPISSAVSSTRTSSAVPETTVMVTPSSTSKPSSSGGSTNVAGIAAGVVVGVVALAGIVFGVWFYLRQKRRRELEEEHKRQAAVNQFFSGGKSHHSQSSMSDSRLDPDIMHRRQSDGSIADNQDYSRRILKVTNPDGY